MKGNALLPNIQICRAFAALIVAVGHSLHDFDSLRPHGAGESGAMTINWGAGIDVFFVLSGFVMVYVAGGEFAKPGAPGRFFVRRLARVVPLYWLLTTVLILAALALPGLLNVPIGALRHIVFSYLFIPDWRPDLSVVRPVMALGWTLNYEMLFYAAFAAALVLPYRAGLAALTTIFAGAALAHVALDVRQTQLAFWTDPIALEFVLGAYVGCARRAGWRLPAVPATLLAAAGIALVAVNLPALDVPDAAKFLRYGLPATMLVASAALAPSVPVNRATVALVALGDASYALYLSHPFVIRPMREIWRVVGGAVLPETLFALACTMVAIGVALVLHGRLDAPIQSALKPLMASGGERTRLGDVDATAAPGTPAA